MKELDHVLSQQTLAFGSQTDVPQTQDRHIEKQQVPITSPRTERSA